MYLFAFRFSYYYVAVYDLTASPPRVLVEKCDRNLLNNINQWYLECNKSVSNYRKHCDIFGYRGSPSDCSPLYLKSTGDDTTGMTKQDTKGVYVSDGFQKIVVCENCLYYYSISEFYNAHGYCIECLCDHASCPICNIGYHAVNISE